MDIPISRWKYFVCLFVFTFCFTFARFYLTLIQIINFLTFYLLSFCSGKIVFQVTSLPVIHSFLPQPIAVFISNYFPLVGSERMRLKPCSGKLLLWSIGKSIDHNSV